jgi:hypothetical protein
MQISIGLETSLFSYKLASSLHVARAKTVPVGNFLDSTAFVFADSIIRSGFLWLQMSRGQSATRKEIRVIRGDVYLSLDVEVKKFFVTACRINYRNKESSHTHLNLDEQSGNTAGAGR